MNWVNIALPGTEIRLSIRHCLLQLIAVGEGLSLFSRYDRCVVEQVDDMTSLLGQNDLLLRPLDNGCGVDIVCFLELLACDICELCFGYQRLSFGSDKFLLKNGQLGGFWFLVFEFLDFILDLDRCQWAGPLLLMAFIMLTLVF